MAYVWISENFIWKQLEPITADGTSFKCAVYEIFVVNVCWV